MVGGLAAKALLARTLVKIIARQLWLKLFKVPREVATAGVALRKAGRANSFLKVLLDYDRRVVEQSRKALDELSARGVRRFSVYGAGGTAEILYALTLACPAKIGAVYDDAGEGRCLGLDVLAPEACARGGEIVVIASLYGIEEKSARLMGLGVARERIVTLR